MLTAKFRVVSTLVCALSLVGCSRNGEPLFTPPPPPSSEAPAVSPLREMLVPNPGAIADGGAPEAPAVAPAAGQPAAEGQPQGERVHVAHLLVMHTNSAMRPPTVTRSLDEARTFATQLLGRIRGGEDLVALSRQHSDEPGHENKGGDLGFITRGMTVAPFENAAFALRVGQVSDVVQTDFGFHIIKRLE
jgi:NIMA-interacting peptidyl-prolyl cis-trans isomerase 1